MIKLKDGIYEYSGLDFIGKGSFGTVFKGKEVATQKEVAIKQISKDKIMNSCYDNYLLLAFQKELEIQRLLTKLKIIFFVKLIDEFEDKDSKYFILELCDRTVQDLMIIKNLSINNILEIIYQTGIGLKFLHELKITHRDIKPANLLLKNNIVKISDFGFSTNKSILQTNVGTPYYKSPEIIQKHVKRKYDNKVDVWALNTCLYYLITKQYFFKQENNIGINRQILKKKFTTDHLNDVNENLKDLLKQGYIKDPRKRPTIEEYLDHKAFDSLKQKYQKFLDYSMKPIKNNNQSYFRTDLKIIEALRNYKLNSLLYSQLFRQFYNYNLNKIYATFLIKRNLQMINQVILSYQNKIELNYSPFDILKIDKETWLDIMELKKFRNLIKEFEEVHSILQPKFESYLNKIQQTKELKNFVNSPLFEALKDDSQKIDKKALIKYLHAQIDSYQNIDLQFVLLCQKVLDLEKENKSYFEYDNQQIQYLNQFLFLIIQQNINNCNNDLLKS